MRKTLGILLILALIAGIFVSCSQDKVGSMVDEDLVSVSFSSEGVSRALTVSRETFNENNYVWYYKSAKADSTGLRQGEKDTWTPVKPTTGTRTGLSGARITGLSQGLWNFELQAYVYDSGDAQDKDYAATGVAAWYGKVTNQSVRKDAANIVYVTVSAISEGNGSIYWKEISGMKELDQQTTLSFAQIVAAGMKVYVSATKVGATAAAAEFTIDSDTIEGMTGLFTAVPYGTYLFNMKVFSGTDIAHADYIYADETIAVNVYSGLKTIITGFISELSSYVEFGEPVANAVIEAETPNIATAPVTEDVVFTNKQTEESTSFSTAVIKADAADAIRTAVIQTVTEGNTLSDLSLALNVEDKGSTDATSGTTTTTTKSFDISLTQIVTQTNDSTGVSTVTSSNVENVSKHLVIDLNVGAGLQNFKAYHNVGGEDKLMGAVTGPNPTLPTETTDPNYNQYGYYWYQSDAGKVTLYVDSFSPFSVTYDTKQSVARVIKPNGTGADYYSLQEAIDAAGDKDTVRVLVDITTDEGYLINKPDMAIKLDVNGKTITVNDGSNINNRAFKVTSGKLSVYGGGTIDAKGQASGTTGTEGTGCYGAFRAEVGTELYLENITLKNYRPYGLNVKVLGATAELKNVVITSVCGGGIEVTDDKGADGTVLGYAKLTGCTMTQSDYRNWCSVPVSVSGGSTVDVYSTSYTGEYGVFVFSSGGTINVHGGNFTATSQAVLITTYDAQYGNDSVINVYGGTFNGPFQIGTSGHEFLNITGGTFDHDPTAYVADGYYAELDPTTSMYTVKQYVARIGETYYKTLQLAWNAAGADDTIVLLKDLTENGFYAYGTYTLDLNGHNLTLRGHSAISGAFGTNGSSYDGAITDLTLKNGTLTLNGAGYSECGIMNYGTLMLKDLIINSACGTVIYVIGEQGGSVGTTTLDNVTINSTNSSGTAFAAYAFKGPYYSPSTIQPIVLIKNSTILAAKNAVMIYATDATVENCTIGATNENALWIKRSANASGVTGTVTVKGNTSIVAGSAYKRLDAQDNNTIEVIEGTYNFDPSNNNNKNFVPEGYQVADNGDGTWTVTKLPSEDEQVLITKTGESNVYMSLADFRDSVNKTGTYYDANDPDKFSGYTYSGYTVTLQCDVTTASDWTPIGASGSSFSGTFDGGNHTITLNDNDVGIGNTSVQDIALFGVVNNGGTIKNLTVAGRVTANKKAAGVIYKLENGSVIDVTNKATVTVVLDKAGGIVANSYGTNTFTNCRNEGAITISNPPSANTNNVAGGIVAYMAKVPYTGSQVFTNCVNTGSVSSPNDNGFVAGIVGYATGGNTNTDHIYGTIRFDGCVNVGTMTDATTAGMLAYAHASSSEMTVVLDDCVDLKGYTLCDSNGTSGSYVIEGTLVVLTETTTPVINASHEYLSGLTRTAIASSYNFGGKNYSVDEYQMGT